MPVKKSERCDYCDRKRKFVILVCPDHLEALDKVASRRVDHPVKSRSKKK